MLKKSWFLYIAGAISIFLIDMAGPIEPAYADPTAIPIGTQLQLSLLSHVTAVAERTTAGVNKLAFLDGIAQFGHYKGDYIAALDAGFLNNTNADAAGHYAMTYGFHVHVLTAITSTLEINPALKDALQLLELNPRYSFDTDVRHGVLTITFGAHIPF